MSDVASVAEAKDARAEHVERAMRALQISGRRLVKISAGWSVMSGVDRRRWARLVLEDQEVERLAGEGRLTLANEDAYVLADVRVEPAPQIEPWAFMIAGKRQTARSAGIGFAALAIRARKGEGPLTIRHVKAGLRLIADAERRDTSKGLTMDWDAGPVDRQRRGGTSGGRRGAAAPAAQRLRRLRALMTANAWALVWAVCIEAASLRGLKERFALSHRTVGKAVAVALEAVALAYES